MELRHIRYFVTLAEELHFGRAAERLSISQPPLSQQIKALEEQLRVILFERTNRRVILTKAGAAFLPEARATLAQAERAKSIVERAGRGEIGELRIGFTPSAPLIPSFTHAVLQFRKKNPGVRLVLEEQTTAEQINALMEKRQDISFVRSPHFPEIHKSLEIVEFYREPLMAVLPAHHPLAIAGSGPLSISMLKSEPFVLFPAARGTNVYDQVLTLCRRAGFTPLIEQEAPANSTILGLVAAGIGLSVLPACLKKIGVPNLVFRQLTGPGTKSSIWLLHHKKDEGPEKRSFISQATKASL